MEFIQLFLGRHFVAKPAVALRNGGCFLWLTNQYVKAHEFMKGHNYKIQFLTVFYSCVNQQMQ